MAFHSFKLSVEGRVYTTEAGIIRIAVFESVGNEVQIERVISSVPKREKEEFLNACYLFLQVALVH